MFLPNKAGCLVIPDILPFLCSGILRQRQQREDLFEVFSRYWTVFRMEKEVET
jgi:hypothetical protein